MKDKINVKNTVVLGFVGSIISILIMLNLIVKKQCNICIGISYLLNDVAFGIYFYIVHKRIKGENFNITIAQKLVVNTVILIILIGITYNVYFVLQIVNRINISVIILLFKYIIIYFVMTSEYIILYLYLRYLFFKQGIKINTNILYGTLIIKMFLVFLLNINNGEPILGELINILIVESEICFIYPYLYVYTKIMKGEY